MQLTVLIVDDDPQFRRCARSLLAARGYWVVGEAESGSEGLALASRLEPDTVLLDVNLPDVDGLAIAARLSEGGGPRVLLTSCDATAASDRVVRRCGAAGFVAKEDLAELALGAYFGE